MSLPVGLRLADASDGVLYRALWEHPTVTRHLAAGTGGPDIDARFDRVVRHNTVQHPGHRAWVVSVADLTPAACGLTALLRDGARAEFGIMLLPHSWGRGVATAALGQLLPVAFGSMALDIVDASRPDDAQVPVIDRLFAPFGFERAPGLRPGEVGWCLTRERWASRGADGRRGATPDAMP
ncbi:GNAT family N-acetyltransferase [Lysobacter xanthus]